ncbi:MAG: hypothetical protein JWO65_1096 [Sphingomonas bacterium]|nr:hypothetical protein [Sphingomonas bacterium]
MTARLAAKVEVSGLIRIVEGRGGSAAVLARGDAEAGAILLFLADRGAPWGFLERALDPSGAYHWRRTGPTDASDSEEVAHYVARRRRIDSDMWVVELDVAGVERFADEMTAKG